MTDKNVFDLPDGDSDVTLGAPPKSVIREHVPERNVIKIRIYTRDALSLLSARKFNESDQKRATFVPGLDWFDRKIEELMVAAEADDPFADQLLKDLEQQVAFLLNEVESQTRLVSEQIKELFASYEASLTLKLDSHCSEADVFVNHKLSIKVLWLIKQIDRLLYYVYQAERHDLLKQYTANEIRHDAKKSLRNLLRVTDRYKHTSVTRRDLAEAPGSKRVGKACKDNERITLSREVLLLEERADCAPKISSRPHGELDTGTFKTLSAMFEGHFSNDQANDGEFAAVAE